MKKHIIYILFTFLVNIANANVYYLSPSGNDATGSGTIGSPWFTFNKAWTVLAAGDTLYLRGGTYGWNTGQMLFGVNGTSGNLVKIWAYPGEQPIITRGVSYNPNTQQDLIYMEGDYFHFKGLEIAYFSQASGESSWPAFRAGYYGVSGTNGSIFENIKYHDNMAGFQIRGNSSNNLILNCDFYRNQDPYGGDGAGTDAYGGADGMNLNFNNGTNNVVRGCRAWWNSDDGFDCWENTGVATFDSCWSFFNGYIPGTFTTAGNGTGFKMGQTTGTTITTTYRIYRNCIATKNREYNFMENNLLGVAQVYNCTSSYAGGLGYWMGAWNAAVGLLRNNISYNDAANDITGSASAVTNSWQGGITLNSADFVSTDSTQLSGSRQSNNSLPIITFMNPVSNSDLLNAGTNVGLPYYGSAPDIGAFEYYPQTTISGLRIRGKKIKFR